MYFKIGKDSFLDFGHFKYVNRSNDIYSVLLGYV